MAKKGRIEIINGKPVIIRGDAEFKKFTLRSAYRNGGLRYSDISEKLFGQIIRMYFEEVINCIFNYNKYTLPLRLGTFRLIEFNTEPSYDIATGKIKAFRQINNKATKQLWCEDEEARQNHIFVYYPIKKTQVRLRFDTYNRTNYRSMLRFFVFKKSRNLQHIFAELLRKGNINTIYKSSYDG